MNPTQVWVSWQTVAFLNLGFIQRKPNSSIGCWILRSQFHKMHRYPCTLNRSRLLVQWVWIRSLMWNLYLTFYQCRTGARTILVTRKKSKFFSQELYNVRLYTVFPLYTVVKFTSQVNGNLFYPVVRTVWVRRIKGPSRSSGLSDQCAPKRAYKPCRLALSLTHCGYISLLPLPCEL